MVGRCSGRGSASDQKSGGKGRQLASSALERQGLRVSPVALAINSHGP